MAPETDDGKVTLAILRNDLLHLTRLVERWCEESEQERGMLAQRIDKHEERLVKLERWPWLMAGVGAFLSPVVIWAIIEILKSLTL